MSSSSDPLRLRSQVSLGFRSMDFLALWGKYLDWSASKGSTLINIAPNSLPRLSNDSMADWNDSLDVAIGPYGQYRYLPIGVCFSMAKY